MARYAGTAEEIRGKVPAVREVWAEIDANVLRSGIVPRDLKELCFRYLAGDRTVMDFTRFGERERAALEWADAIAYDSDRADDALWARLHALFTEEELVELGCAIGFELGQQHWRKTLGLRVELPGGSS